MQNSSKPRIAVLDFEEQECIPGAGRSTAERIASRLGGSSGLSVVDRAEWMRRMTEENLGQITSGELSQECRFHPGWAAERLAVLELDAVVIGRLKRSPDGPISISVMLVDSSGVVLRLDETGAERASNLLTSRRIANAIRRHQPPFEAKVECVRGTSVMMRLKDEFRLRPKDRMRVDRTLESVPDPYLEDDARAFAYLTAAVGEAEIIEVSGQFVLARYSGNTVPRRGENVTLARI